MSIQTEKIKYGIGIVADYSSLALNTREFQEESIEVKNGERKQLNIDSEVGYNPLFEVLSKKMEDYFELRIEEDTDLHTLPIVAKKDTAAAYIRIFVKSGVKATIHEQIKNIDFMGAIIDVVVEDGAEVTYIADQRASDASYVLALRRGFIARDASLTFFDINIGSSIVNSTVYTMLEGNGSSAQIYGAFFGTDSQLMDITHTTIHSGQHTSSDLKTHGALDKKAKGLFRSLIDIRESAPHTSGHQKEETLLLSKGAQISSVPDLEIANNDVSCSHGVSTTNIDDEALFYFHARGMSTDVAKQTIVEGHMQAIVDMIPHKALKEEITQVIQDRTRIKQMERKENHPFRSV